jgi:hypothetical protein
MLADCAGGFREIGRGGGVEVVVLNVEMAACGCWCFVGDVHVKADFSWHRQCHVQSSIQGVFTESGGFVEGDLGGCAFVDVRVLVTPCGQR